MPRVSLDWNHSVGWLHSPLRPTCVVENLEPSDYSTEVPFSLRAVNQRPLSAPTEPVVPRHGPLHWQQKGRCFCPPSSLRLIWLDQAHPGNPLPSFFMHIEIYFQELAYIIVNADKSTSYRAGLVVINSLIFYLGRSLSLHHFWRTVLPSIVFLVDIFFLLSFSTLSISLYSLLACRVLMSWDRGGPLRQCQILRKLDVLLGLPFPHRRSWKPQTSFLALCSCGLRNRWCG